MTENKNVETILKSGTMKSFDPTKNTQEEMQKLVENAPSLFIS